MILFLTAPPAVFYSKNFETIEASTRCYPPYFEFSGILNAFTLNTP